MGTLFILIGGLIGAGSGFKKTFISCWIFLINLSFSIYVSIFLAPLAVPLLDIPGLDAGYKNAIAISGIFIITNIILQKIAEQIIPNPENDFNLPAVAKVFSVATGFLSGILIVGILLYCFMQTPFVRGLSQRKELRATARNTMMGVVHTLNVFSFQSLSPEAEKDLQSIRLIPKKKTALPAKAGRKNQAQPKADKPTEESVKKEAVKEEAVKEEAAKVDQKGKAGRRKKGQAKPKSDKSTEKSEKKDSAKAVQQNKAGRKKRTKPKAEKPADGSEKKDSSASSAKTPENSPDGNKKTDDDDDD